MTIRPARDADWDRMRTGETLGLVDVYAMYRSLDDIDLNERNS